MSSNSPIPGASAGADVPAGSGTPDGALVPASLELAECAGRTPYARSSSEVPTAQLENVTKCYGEKVAVRELSLTLHPGEVFAFLGPNGAGKTTTLKATTGLLRPDKGSITVCGHSMARQAQQAKQYIAYVPDQPFIYDKLTGREFLAFTREMYGVSAKAAEQRIAELSRCLDMNGFLDQLCETYSHGMKQKVAVAAALIHNPRLLIVDEPMVGLDPRTARVTKDLFRALADAGATVFMSTHTLDVAEQLADRIGIIHHGRLIALGTLEELHEQARLGGRLEDVFLHMTEEPGDETAPVA